MCIHEDFYTYYGLNTYEFLYMYMYIITNLLMFIHMEVYNYLPSCNIYI